jgi:hypothetical protein
MKTKAYGLAILILSITSACVLFSCKNKEKQSSTTTTTAVAPETKPAPEPSPEPKPAVVDTPATAVAANPVSPEQEKKIRDFLMSKPGTFGWETKAEKISLDFFPDGRMHIQGPDGEATMWGGKWKLNGDQLTMERTDLGKTVVATAKIDGKNLVLGDRTYTRYVPYRDKK